jgi:putative intracellular protease/amidase
MSRILFVLTSHGRLGETGEDTGFYFGEVTHPWDALTCAGHSVEFASPLGGTAPRTRVKLDDPMDRAFLENAHAVQGIDNTMPLSDVTPSRYSAIHLPGGHGTMWDFAQDERLGDVVTEIYEEGGVVSAICHGPAGLVNAKLSDGSYLIAGKRLTSFTDSEERAVDKARIVPYLLETALRERGASYRAVADFDPHVEVDDRLLTGQNPLSSRLLGNAIVRALDYPHAHPRESRSSPAPASVEDARIP